jgi:hypothetical protein
MTYHSTPRHKGDYGPYNRLVATPGTTIANTVVVPEVPTGVKRLIGSGTEGGPMVGNLDWAIRGILRTPNAAEGSIEPDVDIFVRNSAGERFPIRELADIAVTQNVIPTTANAIVLEEGESLVMDILDTSLGAGEVETVMPFIDLNGPIVTRRVVLTDDWQDIVPAPKPGKYNLPIGQLSSAVPFNLAYVGINEDGSADGDVDLRRREAGVTVYTGTTVFTTTDGSLVSFDPDNQAPLFASIRAGQAVQGRLGAGTPGVAGSVVTTAYLELDT